MYVELLGLHDGPNINDYYRNPLLSSFGLNMHEQTDEKQRNIIICKKILLDAGADATLRNSQAKNGWERSAIMKAVSELHVVSLTVISIIIGTGFNIF
jgi:hypothetical protein